MVLEQVRRTGESGECTTASEGRESRQGTIFQEKNWRRIGACRQTTVSASAPPF
jgi:hypothetical protein